MNDKLEGAATLIVCNKDQSPIRNNSAPQNSKPTSANSVQKISVTFTNGLMKDTQTGFIQNKLKDGTYIINYPNGVLYQGEVVESMRHGYGTLYAPQFRNMPQKMDFESEDFDFEQFLKLTKYKTFEGEFRFN